MAERFKAHAWKACVRESVPWVRIPLPPPRRGETAKVPLVETLVPRHARRLTFDSKIGYFQTYNYSASSSEK